MSHVPELPATRTVGSTSPMLNRLCLLLACGLLAGWASTRVKPLWGYGVLFGFLTGAAAVAVTVWFPRPDRFRYLVETMILAGLGLAATFHISAERAWVAALKAGTPGAAEALIAAMSDLPPEATSLPSTPVEDVLIVRKDATLPQRHQRWSRLRYGAAFPGGYLTAELLEVLLAMVTAGCVGYGGRIWLNSTRTNPERPAAPV